MSDYQNKRKSGWQTNTQLPRCVDGGTLPAVYPKSSESLSADGESTAEDTPRTALLHTTASDALFSVAKTPASPFCPLPANTLLLASVPAGEKIKVSKATTVVWL